MPGSRFLFSPTGMNTKAFENCNVAMVQRLSSKSNYEAINLFKSMKLKIVYDLDDDMWAVPTYNPAYKIMKAWLPGFEACAKMADMITVSTHHLAVMVRNVLGKECPRVVTIENSIDYDWFRPVNEKYRKNKNGKVIVGWAGTNTHSGDLKKVFHLIPSLMRELPQMEFEIVGEQIPEEWVKEFGEDRIRQRDFVPIAEFAVNWASWQWDISLSPLDENKFNLSKSNIKMLEASAVKIPCVASNFGEYQKFASGSKLLRQAVMAGTEHTWKRCIKALVEDESYRKAIGEEMYRVGKEKYDIVKRLPLWEDSLAEVAFG
jgi:glycosyltransferase involved in cell wall biosynthesis